MRILLVEPAYYTMYPPLGLLKLGKLEERAWNEVELVRGTVEPRTEPDKIYITSLFTFTWKPVHDAIAYYHARFPAAEIHVGGIYATLMPHHIAAAFPYVRLHSGLVWEAEDVLPAYHLLQQVERWKDWNKSILFTTRGCIRKCPFCVVPKMEGGMKQTRKSILPLIHTDHDEVVIWDNDFLASPYARDVLCELRDGGYRVDFNQGLDARLMTEDFAGILADLRMPTVHMAYDWPWEGPFIKKAIGFMGDAGYRTKNLIFYVLHNFYDFQYQKGDTPVDFLRRLQDLMLWRASAYPMRFIPLDSLSRSGFVSPLWSAEELEMIAEARRVLGVRGTFVYFDALAGKFQGSRTLAEAMGLRPPGGEPPAKRSPRSLQRSTALPPIPVLPVLPNVARSDYCPSREHSRPPILR